jgi:V/A-type H+/Na+-transporting ATPase subunit I
MPWSEGVQPLRMQRVAVVAPVRRERDVLVRLADAGVAEIDRPEVRDQAAGGAPAPATALLLQLPDTAALQPRLAATAPDLAALVAAGRADLVAGEAQLESYLAAGVHRRQVTGWAGWVPSAELDGLAGALARVGGGLVPLPLPRGVDPPTMLRPGGQVRRSMTPLVETYATVPYRDVDPTLLAGLAYVLMFGMMFGDVGHGALLVLAGIALGLRRPRRWARFHKVWPFGEFFGPTGVVPVLWLSPLEEPVRLLTAALGVGAVLLAGAYAVGAVNRWREGGWPHALVAASGIAGATLFAGVGLVLLGADAALHWLVVLGVVTALSGVVLAYVGFLANAGGSVAGFTQATVELFDMVLRLGTNLVSFARLAAFGLTHAALGLVVWEATVALWGRGGGWLLAAVTVFLLGNAVAFTLEALVAGVQALRLEYYELFSRVFSTEGRPFRPWHVPLDVPAAESAATDLVPTPGRKP